MTSIRIVSATVCLHKEGQVVDEPGRPDLCGDEEAACSRACDHGGGTGVLGTHEVDAGRSGEDVDGPLVNEGNVVDVDPPGGVEDSNRP